MKSIQEARLYGIVDLGYVAPDSIERVTTELCEGGVDILQLRAKGYRELEVEELGQRKSHAPQFCELIGNCQTQNCHRSRPRSPRQTERVLHRIGERDHFVDTDGAQRMVDKTGAADEHHGGTVPAQRLRATEQHADAERSNEVELGDVDNGRTVARGGFAVEASVDLRDGDRVVGFIGTIWSVREIGGKTERFCNLSSWITLPEYRNHSLQLFKAVMELRDCTITCHTPAGPLYPLYRRFGFSDLETKLRIIRPLPAWQPFAQRRERKRIQSSSWTGRRGTSARDPVSGQGPVRHHQEQESQPESAGPGSLSGQ